MKHICIFILCFVTGAITGATDSIASGDNAKSKSSLVENFLKNRKKGGKPTSEQDKVQSRSGGGNMMQGHREILPQGQGMMQNGHGVNIAQGKGGNFAQGQGGFIPQGQGGAISQPLGGGVHQGQMKAPVSPPKTPFIPPPSFGSQPQRQPRPASTYSSGFPSSFKSSFSPSSSSSYNFGGSSFGLDKNKAGGGQNTQMCNIGGRQLFVGDTWSITGICALFTCRENHFRTVTSVCPALKYQESYKCEVLMQDLNLDYPQCCPRLSCSTADSHPAQQKDNNNKNNNAGGYSSLFNRSPKQQI